MQALRMGFLSVRQKSARGGRGFVFCCALRWFCLRFAAAVIVPATPAAARAVVHAELMPCLLAAVDGVVAPGGPPPAYVPPGSGVIGESGAFLVVF